MYNATSTFDPLQILFHHFSIPRPARIGSGGRTGEAKESWTSVDMSKEESRLWCQGEIPQS